MKHNNALMSNHFNKNAMKYKMWFNQPARALKRRNTRNEKARKQYPIPVKKLLPVVRQPTQRYNHKVRLGRGFTKEEISAAGVELVHAMKVGIKFDKRRKDRNTETFNRNVERIKEYLSHIKIYKTRKDARDDGAVSFKGIIMPVRNEKPVTKFISVGEINEFVENFSG